MAENPGGPNLWTGLSIDEIKELIKFSAGELCRCYAQKSRENIHRFVCNGALESEIKAFEYAQDCHWQWLRESTNETTRPIRITG